MQDDENKIYIELTEEEFEFIKQVKNEYFEKLGKMTLDERLQYFREQYCIEDNLNFEKEINGTIYKVNAYFDRQANESILQKLFRLTKNL